jgi:hypothetical protein
VDASATRIWSETAALAVVVRRWDGIAQKKALKHVFMLKNYLKVPFANRPVLCQSASGFQNANSLEPIKETP